MSAEEPRYLRLPKTEVRTAVKKLLEAGASVSHADKKGHTALHLGAYAGRTSAVEELLAAGQTSMPPRPLASVPYIWPRLPGQLETVLALIRANANVNAKDSAEGTPLGYAQAKGYNEVAEALLAAGAGRL